jgi:predicted nucleic acid-binding protein
MIVVFDTNIWKSQIYLQSAEATATRFFLRQKQARLGLPEVIKREVETHLKRDILKHISAMKVVTLFV